MAITLPELPYKTSALAPHISKKTVEFHYGKHTRGYVDKMNKAIKGTELDDAELEEVVRAAAANGDQGLFNNAAQSWNHIFYWRSMKPRGGAKPKGDLSAAINDAFEDFSSFQKAFSDAGTSLFGSGWVWLVQSGGKLEIVKTTNANTPLTQDGVTPLLTMDVWEHAYYLDQQNNRGAYVDAFLNKLVNWEFASDNLSNA